MQLGQLQLNLAQGNLGQNCSNEEPPSFSRGDNNETAKIYEIYKSLYSGPLGQFQLNLAQRNFGKRKFKFVQIMDQALLQREGNNKIAKIHRLS